MHYLLTMVMVKAWVPRVIIVKGVTPGIRLPSAQQ